MGDPWKAKLRKKHCEVCGNRAMGIAPDGWWACHAHWTTPRSEYPDFDWISGEPLPPNTDPTPWRSEVRDLEKLLNPPTELEE